MKMKSTKRMEGMESMEDVEDVEAHRIAVISDTHGVLRPEVEETLRSCELILHAGDMDDADSAELYERLVSLGPTYAVRGNVDGDWARKLPKELEREFCGFRIYMVHNKAFVKTDLEGVDIVIFGHSHKYEEERREGILFLNPGSCGRRRFTWPLSMAILTLCPSEHRAETERIVIGGPASETVSQKGENSGQTSETVSQKGESSGLRKKDMDSLVRRIMRDVDAGHSVDEIAGRHHVDRELAEQVCRMYVTHPGVDVDGILDRLALRAGK